MIIQKQYARRNITGYTSPYEDALDYHSIVTMDADHVNTILRDAMKDSAARDIGEEGWSSLADFREFAGEAYHPETWCVAYNNNEPVGVVFAQRYDDRPEEGSLFFIGVLPEHRGKGYAKVLHAKGLEMLAAIGVTEYVGSTDIANAPMIRAFAANGCRLYAVRDVELGKGLV
jgi:GNAT superfamily N-acetyltransferase